MWPFTKKKHTPVFILQLPVIHETEDDFYETETSILVTDIKEIREISESVDGMTHKKTLLFRNHQEVIVTPVGYEQMKDIWADALSRSVHG
jgi:predicted amino acid racemase